MSDVNAVQSSQPVETKRPDEVKPEEKAPESQPASIFEEVAKTKGEQDGAYDKAYNEAKNGNSSIDIHADKSLPEHFGTIEGKVDGTVDKAVEDTGKGIWGFVKNAFNSQVDKYKQSAEETAKAADQAGKAVSDTVNKGVEAGSKFVNDSVATVQKDIESAQKTYRNSYNEARGTDKAKVGMGDLRKSEAEGKQEATPEPVCFEDKKPGMGDLRKLEGEDAEKMADDQFLHEGRSSSATDAVHREDKKPVGMGDLRKEEAKQKDDAYVVKSGDNLCEIFKKYNPGASDREAYLGALEIAKNNDIKDPNLIQPGQIVRIKPAAKKEEASPEETKAAKPSKTPKAI